MYIVYVLYSSKYKKFYIGYTTSIDRRLEQHNRGLSKATAPYKPYELVFYETFLNKNDAKSREKYLKTGWGWRSLKKMLKNTLIAK